MRSSAKSGSYRCLHGLRGTAQLFVQARFDDAKRVAKAKDEPVMGLVEKYLGGWRPKDFDS